MASYDSARNICQALAPDPSGERQDEPRPGGDGEGVHLGEPDGAQRQRERDGRGGAW